MDASGKNLVKFQLPALGSVNQALLVARVTDGGVIETFSKTIPVVLNQLEVPLIICYSRCHSPFCLSMLLISCFSFIIYFTFAD